jgi:DNA repair protein RadA/Sms
MKSPRAVFACTECGNETLRWEGRCPACGAWNTLVEDSRAARGPGTRHQDVRFAGPVDTGPVRLGDAAEDSGLRTTVGFGDVDRVLGGGLVEGSIILLGGEPGVGKSTLLLQVAARVQASGAGVLYVSGEESREQVSLRAGRLRCNAGEIAFLADTDLDGILNAAKETQPRLLCIDSIQTLRSDRVSSAPGSVSQVRECAAVLQAVAKTNGITTVLVGHVTKDGTVAGPRTLEHMVDAVLYFEGQRASDSRILRAAKNRFGSVDELAAFRMGSTGLEPIIDPAALFLSDRPDHVPGSAIAIPLQGTRPLPAEVQALTARARFSAPQRVETGFPSRRLSMLLAVLERRAGLSLTESDVFLNVIGGLRLADPAADLAVVAALVSAELDRPTPARMSFIGEVGLGGELRAVSRPDARIREAVRAGLRVAVPSGLADAEGLPADAVLLSSVKDTVLMLSES